MDERRNVRTHSNPVQLEAHSIALVLAVSLPVFNEAAGIADFLEELHHYLAKYNPLFIVVDDHSSDATPQVLEALQRDGFPIRILRNDKNRGHGISVLRGLDYAITINPDRIVLCDGDGQFEGRDVEQLVSRSTHGSEEIVEGVRIGRDDPWFRRALSLGTRVLVRLSSGKHVVDANTPLRVIATDVASQMFAQVPPNCPVPNLAISAISRSRSISLVQIPVQSRPPRRPITATNHWRQRFPHLPSMRLLRFSMMSLSSWLTVHRVIVRNRSDRWRQCDLEP